MSVECTCPGAKPAFRIQARVSSHCHQASHPLYSVSPPLLCVYVMRVCPACRVVRTAQDLVRVGSVKALCTWMPWHSEWAAAVCKYGASYSCAHVHDADELVPHFWSHLLCCCLHHQVTFQAKDLAESRYLYDQLSVLSPIFVSSLCVSCSDCRFVSTQGVWCLCNC